MLPRLPIWTARSRPRRSSSPAFRRASGPTPCTGVDVRALVNHLVTGNLLFAAIASETPPPDRSADHLGDDPLAAFRQAGDALRAAFARPGVFAKTYVAPFSATATAVALVQTRVIENLGHGWDLAQATGQQASFPDDVAERALAAARQILVTRPEGAGAPFAPEVPVPADAPAIDRLAGYLGRTVQGLR
jgi:uncharacterized protein (TIGR03086 family)